MNRLFIFVLFVLALQITVFLVLRAKRKKDKRESVIEKYNIRTPGDAFRLLQDHSLPDEDRRKIEQLYKGGE